MDKLKHICSYLPTIGLLIAIFSLPYHYGALQRTGLYIAGIGFVVDYLVNMRWQVWQWSRDKWIYIVFVLFYLCIPLRQLFDLPGDWLFANKIETYLSFLIIGVLGFAGGNHTMRLEYVAATMLLSCLSMAGVLCHAMWNIPLTDFASWQAQLNLQRIAHINSHMVVNVYSNMTLVFCMWTLLRSQCRPWLKWLIGVLMAGVVIGLTISEGRVGQITLVLLVAFAVGAWLVHTHRIRWIVPGLVGVGLLACALWMLNPRYHEYSMQNNARMRIWPVATRMIQEKPLFGWGVSAARQEFVRRGMEDEDFRIYYLLEFEASSMERHGKVNYQVIHPHNAFLETWMEFGVVGVILFLLCLLLPILLLPIGHDRWFVAAGMLVFFVQAMFESMGSEMTPLWIPLLTYLWMYNHTSEPNRSERPIRPAL